MAVVHGIRVKSTHKIKSILSLLAAAFQRPGFLGGKQKCLTPGSLLHALQILQGRTDYVKLMTDCDLQQYLETALGYRPDPQYHRLNNSSPPMLYFLYLASEWD